MHSSVITDVSSGLKRNFRLYAVTNFLTSAQFSLPIYMLFGVQHLHISYLQAGLLFLISWIVSLSLDFLSGIFADRYGRKRAFIIGIGLQVIATMPFVFSRSYPLLLAVSVIIGVGMALVSNTIGALLYEQAEEEGSRAYFQHANATASAYSYISRIGASIVGGFVYAISPTLPYLLTILTLVLALVAVLSMKFTQKVQNNAEPATQGQIGKAALLIFRSNPALIKFVVIILLISIWGDYLFTYYQPYYSQLGVSSKMLGFLYASISLLSALGTIAMRKLPDVFSPNVINSLTLIGIMVTATVLLGRQVPLVYLAPIGLALVSGFGAPNLSLYINKHAPNGIRTSVLSVATTASGIGSGIGILVSLKLLGHVSSEVFLSVAIIGCVVSLAINTGLGTGERGHRKSPASVA